MIILLTPTRDRPEAFKLCQRWMDRQSLPFDRWIVATDGGQMSRPLLDHMEFVIGTEDSQNYANRTPVESFTDNLRSLLDAVPTGDHICIVIEDDDWYRPDHVQHIADLLERQTFVGLSGGRYYHVSSGRHHQFPANDRAPLCTVGFRSACIDWIRPLITGATIAVDHELWRHARSMGLRPQPSCPTVVGMKGLPGSANLGIGKTMGDQGRFPVDQDGSILRAWVGPEDAQVYARYREQADG